MDTEEYARLCDARDILCEHCIEGTNISVCENCIVYRILSNARNEIVDDDCGDYDEESDDYDDEDE